MKFYSPSVAFRAVCRIAWAALTQKPLFVTPETAARRHAQCKARDGGCYDEVTGRCQVCTCYASVKTLFATEKCPRGHWKREHVEHTL